MDLLKTILLYLTMVFVSSVQTAPEPSLVPETPTPSPMVISATATYTPAPTATPTPVPTPNITPNTEYKTLKVGDKGDSVATLQRRLTELGYYTGVVDGVFGNQTRRSVERFQYYQGLSVDGIAGKRTQTVLYESTEVVFAPVDVTPSPTATVKSITQTTAAITSQPPTTTPAPTFAPAPTTAQTTTAAPVSQASTAQPTDTSSATATATASATVAATETPATTDSIEVSPSAEATAGAGETLAPSASPEALEPQETVTAEPVAPALNTDQVFILEGQLEPMTYPLAETTGETTPESLHPLMVGDQTFVPLLEILRSTGSVILPAVENERLSVAFSMGADLYQISYIIDNEGAVTDLDVQKNQTPMILTSREAYILDGILYLPAEVSTEITGITYMLDVETGVYTVVMPDAGSTQTP